MSRQKRQEVKHLYLSGLLGSLWSIFKSITLVDVFDIALLSLIIFKLIQIIRETRAVQLAKGILFLLLAYFTCYLLKFKAMEFLLSVILNNGFIAILIMFQPEMRRTLEKVGRTTVSKLAIFNEHPDDFVAKWETAISEICSSVEELSATKTGALIVLERKTRLGLEISSGTMMECLPSKELLGNIFYPKTPLHDGAVIMRNGMIVAAACYLPKPEREELIDKKLGSRHRAAIGMSENSDAVIVVVSEETGTISVACNGKLFRNFSPKSLSIFLIDHVINDRPDEENESRKHLRLLNWRKKK
ncbi:MAG: diadenylate cyclase CdaA [Oscillospiraceae bacterium]|nr:diadenylate cyclase CdaA [Oscillospiraceae bacterium]